MKMKRFWAVAVAAVLMTGMACASAAEANALTMEDALAIALERARQNAADVFVTQLDQDKDDGRRMLEVEFIAGEKEYEYGIDASTGEIIEESIKSVSGRKSKMDTSLYLSMEAAREKALMQAGVAAEDAAFTELSFDFDDGRAAYELRFTAGEQTYQVELDALTGEILKYEMKSANRKK